MSEWISVNDYLPCYGQKVIVFSYGKVQPYIMDFEFMTSNSDGFTVNNGLVDLLVGEVTHWMPLPDPPKDNL